MNWKLNLSAATKMDLDSAAVPTSTSSRGPPACTCTESREALEFSKSFPWEVNQLPLGWPNHIASLLGLACSLQPLACASRCTARWLLLSSMETVAGFRAALL